MPTPGIETPSHRDPPAARREAPALPVADLPALAGVLLGAAPILLGLAAGGGILGWGLSKLESPKYRATAPLLVVEPRLLGSGGSVDFNLTPIRSYTALLGSPALAAGCASVLPPGEATRGAARLARGVKTRLPEQTRVLEISFESSSPEGAAAFVNCLAAKAVAENRRINAEIAAGTRGDADAALAAAAAEAAAAAKDLSGLRAVGSPELLRARLRAALADVEAATREEREASIRVAAEEARRRELESAAGRRPDRRRYVTTLSRDRDAAAVAGSADGGTPVLREEADPVRDFAETRAGEARGDEAAARAALAEARTRRLRAEHAAVALEPKVAELEARVAMASRRADGAGEALGEIAKRRSALSLETASRAFGLVPLAPALPPDSPSRPNPFLSGLAGALAAGGVGAFVAIARSGRG